MTTRVVDYLELIQIDVQQRIRALPTLRAEHCGVKAIVELAAIDEACQGIMAGLIGQSALEPPLLGDVMEYDDGADHTALPIADRTAAGLVETPGSQSLSHGIDVFDTAIRIGTDHRVTDRLQRHLCTLLLGKYSLLGAFAFSDVRNGTLIPDDPVTSIAHRACIFEDHDLLPIPSAHPKLCTADLAFRFHEPHELGPVGGVPIEHGNAW